MSADYLDSSIRHNSNTNRATKTATVDDDDESCMMLIGNGNQHNSLDESTTMEIPLLDNNNDDYHSQQTSVCKCGQPGFERNLKSKSTEDAKLKIFLAIILCCIFMIVEFIGGYFAGSLAIMTDAAHLASDCISFVIGLMAIWIGSKPPDKIMSFGYKRMEVMGAIVSILGIWILTATLVLVAVQRLYTDDFDLDANTMMAISVIGILINIAMAYILHGSALLPSSGTHSHSHSHSHSHDFADDMQIVENSKLPNKHTCTVEENLNLRAAIIHVIGDLVQSIGVFIASILIKFFPQAKFADPLCTLLFSVIVIMTTTKLFKESIAILLDSVPVKISLGDLERDLCQIGGVKSVHHLNVWNHTVNHSVMMVHLAVDIMTDSDAICLEATKVASSRKYNIKHSTIQIERFGL